MKKILYVVFCVVGCSLDAMQKEPIDRSDIVHRLVRGKIADLDLEMGYQSAQQGDDEGLTVDQVTALIYEQRHIEDHYEQAHLSLMVRQLYERDGQRYHKLIGEVIPRRGQTEQNSTEEVDKLYAGLMQIKESVNKTNELIQHQIDGDDEQEIVDTRRWRLDFVSNCYFGIMGVIVGALGSTLIVEYLVPLNDNAMA